MRFATILLATCCATPVLAEAPVPPVHPALAPTPYGALSVPPLRPALGSQAYRLMALEEAARAGLPYALVDAVMKIESDYRPERIGDVGEIGLMQVRPGTAAMLGFRGTPAELADPQTNIHYGASYLGQAWHLTKGNVCRTLMKYRAGHGSEVMSALSASYCARARAHLVAIGSPLAAAISDADLAAASVAVVADAGSRAAAPVPGRGRARSGKAFWTAMESKVARIDARLEARWNRVAAR